MEPQIVIIGIVFGVWVVIAIVMAVRQGKSPLETRSDIERAAGAAYRLVLAADQLKKVGDLPADERQAWVLERLREIYPTLDEETLLTTIESVVGEINELRQRPKRVDHRAMVN
jgi:hypothetical protein